MHECSWNLLFSRKDDIVARFRGEEFIILLGNTNLEQGINQCQRIKEHFRKLNISHEKSFLDKRLTLSQGLICVDPNIIIDSNIIYNFPWFPWHISLNISIKLPLLISFKITIKIHLTIPLNHPLNYPYIFSNSPLKFSF